VYKFWLRIIPPMILGSVLFMACSRPAVKHTSIGGEVKEIAAWRVVIEDITDIPAEGSPDFDADRQRGLLFREKATADYRDKIISGLRENDLPVSSSGDNAVIKIKINWYKSQVITPTLREEEQRARQEDRERAGSIRDDSLTVELDKVAAAFLPEDNQVNRVEVDLSDGSGFSLGKIFIGDRVEGQVKPEFVAKVIARILREGKY